jgi:ubiquitin C-terminal hydrolase
MNSSIQALLSIPHFSTFFAEDHYLKHLNPKEVKDNNCMLMRKLSKTVKKLTAEGESFSPWGLKSQVDYNLHPVRLGLYSSKATGSTMPTSS